MRLQSKSTSASVSHQRISLSVVSRFAMFLMFDVESPSAMWRSMTIRAKSLPMLLYTRGSSTFCSFPIFCSCGRLTASSIHAMLSPDSQAFLSGSGKELKNVGSDVTTAKSSLDVCGVRLFCGSIFQLCVYLVKLAINIRY